MVVVGEMLSPLGVVKETGVGERCRDGWQDENLELVRSKDRSEPLHDSLKRVQGSISDAMIHNTYACVWLLRPTWQPTYLRFSTHRRVKKKPHMFLCGMRPMINGDCNSSDAM